MKTLEEILEVLRSHKEEIRKRFKAEVIGVFGSFSRGEENEESDVDLLVRFLPGASLFDLVALADYLEEKLGMKVDIVSERVLREELRERVMRDLVKL